MQAQENYDFYFPDDFRIVELNQQLSNCQILLKIYLNCVTFYYHKDKNNHLRLLMSKVFTFLSPHPGTLCFRIMICKQSANIVISISANSFLSKSKVLLARIDFPLDYLKDHLKLKCVLRYQA